MTVKITRLDYTCGTGESKGGYQVRIGKGRGKSLYCGDSRHGGKRAAKQAATKVGAALETLTLYFPDLMVSRAHKNGVDK